ncbi:hypothetical protein TNCV_1037751 [Trichonephila clavipes]|nr:hypothetical protein TNCV_1037751 [Trichonephila clavipes]
MPATIRYLDHLATAATRSCEGNTRSIRAVVRGLVFALRPQLSGRGSQVVKDYNSKNSSNRKSPREVGARGREMGGPLFPLKIGVKPSQAGDSLPYCHLLGAEWYGYQSRGITGGADHQYLISPSVGTWRKIHFYDWHCSDRFVQYRGSEHVKRHPSLPMKSSWRRCSINMFLKSEAGWVAQLICRWPSDQRIQVRLRPKSVDLHYAENRQKPYSKIMRHIKTPLSARLA